MADEGLSRMSLTEISGAIAKREVSSKEVVLNTLELLENQGTSLNCVARLFTEDALNDAELADQELTYANSTMFNLPISNAPDESSLISAVAVIDGV